MEPPTGKQMTSRNKGKGEKKLMDKYITEGEEIEKKEVERILTEIEEMRKIMKEDIEEMRMEVKEQVRENDGTSKGRNIGRKKSKGGRKKIGRRRTRS